LVGEGVTELRIHVGAGYVHILDGMEISGDPALRRRQAFAARRYQAGQSILDGLETEAKMSKLKGAVSHHEREIAELSADRELAVAHLKAAMESLDNPDDRAAGLLALRTVAEAYGGLTAVAAEAGISRESLYRSLSPKGNPTLKTLLAVLKTVGLRLSVEPEHHTHV
jgi:probable addiction module antidote protein